ncbi:MAG: chromate transporter [Muribaculaceae bacterium]|nr:chromate transporter [Muribaculaceae bacterium]
MLGTLFITFAKIGAFTFGGGWAMISLIEREIVDKRRWISREDFLDLLAVAQALPGLLAVNVSVVVGDKLRGLKGATVASLGTIMPSFIIILLIAMFLTPETITSSPTLTAIFKGIRPVVVALIIAPVFTTARSAHIGWKLAWVPAVVALLIWSKLPVVSNPILFIVLGGLVGYLMARRAHGRLQKSECDGKDERRVER